MATSYDALGPDHLLRPDAVLRLTLAELLHAGPLSGAWWPRSRDLRDEAATLLARFPTTHGRILRIVVSPEDWDGTPRHVPAPEGPVEVGLFPGEDTQVVVLGLASGVRLRLRLVDAGTEPWRAQELARAACAPRGTRSASTTRGPEYPRRHVGGP